MTSVGDRDPEKSDLKDSVASLFQQDEELLLAHLGALQLGETLGVRPSDFGRFLRVGRIWLDSQLVDGRRLVCDDAKVIGFRRRLESDAATEVATVSDLLLSAYGQIPATIMAVIIVKRGLQSFCGPLD